GAVGGGVELLEEVWSCWRRCGAVGGGVELLEEVCHLGWVLRFQKFRLSPVSLSSCCLPISM
ncbi:hypothetical protein LEMLEM_LOCUS21419, partial [Lemmus lemmus]